MLYCTEPYLRTTTGHDTIPKFHGTDENFAMQVRVENTSDTTGHILVSFFSFLDLPVNRHQVL